MYPDRVGRGTAPSRLSVFFTFRYGMTDGSDSK